MGAPEEEGWPLLKAAPHFVFKLHACFRSEAEPVVDMVAVRGFLRTGRQTFLCSSLSIWAIVFEVGAAHVRICVCCVTSSSAAIGVSKLAVHFFVVLAVCHRGVGEPLVLFADVVWSGVCGGCIVCIVSRTPGCGA
jgi:hypothetical protein